MLKTYSQKPAEVKRAWYLIDADGLVLGRLATVVAGLLTGKGKVSYSPHVDGGDHVVVINAASVKLTGNKEQQKIYYRHSGYPGNLKQATAAEVRAAHPKRLVEQAVRGMIAKNKLRAGRLERLRVFAGPDHNHQPQQPKVFKLGGK